MKTSGLRVVLDTNILISYVFWPESPVRQMVDNIFRDNTVLTSYQTYSELCEVIMRRKFDKYLPISGRESFLIFFRDKAGQVQITERINACADEDDNKFLELAVCGKADVIITGDSELLALDPFRGIRVLSLQNLLGK